MVQEACARSRKPSMATVQDLLNIWENQGETALPMASSRSPPTAESPPPPGSTSSDAEVQSEEHMFVCDTARSAPGDGRHALPRCIGGVMKAELESVPHRRLPADVMPAFLTQG
ncbi:hypothetical protein FH972_021525 [Carpinus fangiana]|uniref:Uncharacterized protein n=1 Tax=Carpinus fangiana TaxID=176857 RepID=A0A5N6KPX8_9ROSI|nr:hypothetical protein FH972_021525 [Carpinus fangiana]